MKVTIVVPAISRHAGGIAEIVRLLARAIEQQPGFEIDILSIKREGYESDLPPFAGLRVRCFRFFGPSTYGFSPGLLWAVLWSRPDLMHVHAIWGFHVFAVHLWHLLTGRPYVVTPHGMMDAWILKRSRRLKAAVSGLYQNAFLGNATAFQINAEAERPVVSAMVPNAKITVVANQVDAPRAIEPRPPWWSPALEGRQIYLFFGRIHEKKGIVELIEAWDRLSSGNPQFRDGAALVVAGWNDGLENFEAGASAVAARHGNVFVVGPQFGDAKWASYRSARFFVLPSKSEGQPMAVLEAWACGVPSLMTEACNLNIGFDYGAAMRSGMSAEEIVTALKITFEIPDARRETMSRAALALVDEQCSPRVIGTKMAELYLASAAKSGRRVAAPEAN